VSPLAKLGLALGGAALLAASLIVTSVLVTRDGGTKTIAFGATLPGAGEVVAELRGIPQQRFVLGRADAPVTLVEYADMQCPFCAQWAIEVFPELVRDYVRTGKLRIEWRGIAFIGQDSEDALRAVDAAALQNRLWHTAEIMFRNQGPENGGWVTDDFVRAAARSGPGLNVAKLLADRDSKFVADAMARANSQANEAGVDRTPSFQIGNTGAALRLMQVPNLQPQTFKDAVEEQLKR
jgi:protein-disulfide isomerase